MRITNNMMLHNTSMNINGNKGNVLNLNSQMTSQKKIQRPSDNPVIAIRSLRLRTSLSKINQYYDKNIPDVETWLETSETALKNMNKILTDVKTQCNTGTNDYLTEDDRNTILKSLTALKQQLYSEGNADNAGRTVFTGYKTSSQLTFMNDETDTSYQITQNFTYKDVEEFTYYSGKVDMPNTADEMLLTENIPEIDKEAFDRIRLAYDGIDGIETLSYSYGGNTVTFDTGVPEADGSVVYTSGGVTLTVYETEDDWAAANDGIKTVEPGDMVLIKSTGDLVMGKELSSELKSNKADFQIDYQKTGFETGVLRPEYYYNCTDVSDPANPIEHTKFDADGNKIYEDINYTVALNQTLKVNLQADEIFDMSIYQDVEELTETVQAAINAHDKVKRLEEMQNQAQFADCQEELKQWLEAAKKEADYADKRLTEHYSAGIGKFNRYIEKLNIAYTEVGARGDQLEMTQARMSNQQLTIEELKSSNEDKELSDIIIEYTAAYNAYTASLMSAGKINQQTLLDYI